jgi:PAS domain S-box-containing protein
VVLVDDSEAVRVLVRQRLDSFGFDVVGEGVDGDEAILLAHRLQPALLLLDISMPRVDGVEALPAILGVSPATKVVMFTGFEERGLVARARGLGACGFVEKSIPLEELPQRLLRILNDGPAGHEIPRHARRVVADLSEGGKRLSPPDGGIAAEEQAVLSEHVQQFRDLFDRAQVGMATLTANGTIVRANRALAGLMSCSPHDLVGIDYGRLTEGKGDELDRLLVDVCTLGEEVTSFEHYLPSAPGEEADRIVTVTLAPIRDSSSQVLYVFAQVHDVTVQRMMERALRNSQDNFRRLVTAVTEYAIYMLDVHGNVISWNSGAERIKGYAAHEVLGRPFRIFYPHEAQATGHPARNLEAALRQGSYAEEGWRVRKDGGRFWASVVISPVFNDNGHHVGFAKVTRDQTQQRAFEEERRALLDQRIRLLAVTAHELRTPIAVIDGSAGSLDETWEQVSSDERSQMLGNIRSSADRLRRLATDLTTAAHLDGGTVSLRLESVSITETLRSARSRSLATHKESLIELDVPHEATFQTDPGRLAQALDNLLDNALRHGAQPIALTATMDDQVHIVVADAGKGVPTQLIPRLFEPFAMAGPHQGTGLGLYLVRQIARELGGDAQYRSPTKANPAAFEMTLPTRPC